MNIINWLKGKKTYILAICGILFYFFGLVTGNIDQATAQQGIWIGLMAVAGRAGIAKLQ